MTDTTTPGEDLVAALAEVGDPGKSGKAQVRTRDGQTYSYTYMQLPDLLKSVRETLAKHRLAVMQQVHSDGEAVTVTTVLIHASGERWLSEPLSIRTRGAAQDIGSAATYARRYSLAAFVGLAGDDDDDAMSARPPVAAPPARPPQLDTHRPDDTPIPPARDHTRGSLNPGSASPKSVKAMWAGLTDTHMSEAQIRGWVASILQISPDWSTKDLSQYQVSMVIDRLRQEEQHTLGEAE